MHFLSFAEHPIALLSVPEDFVGFIVWQFLVFYAERQTPLMGRREALP